MRVLDKNMIEYDTIFDKKKIMIR